MQGLGKLGKARKTNRDLHPAGGFQLAVPFGEDRRFQPRQLVHRRHITQGAEKPHGVVVIDVSTDPASGFAQRRRDRRTHSLPLQAAVPPLQVAVGLRVKQARPHVRDAGDADELLEIPGDELRAVVADDPRPGVGETLQATLDDRFGDKQGCGQGHLTENRVQLF